MSELIKEVHFSHDYWVLLLPLILIVLDVITGIVNAWIKGDLSSSTMRKGLGHKISEFVYLSIGWLCSLAFNFKSIYYFISIYIIYMEILSIIENCKKLGTKAPEKVTEELDEIGKKLK